MATSAKFGPQDMPPPGGFNPIQTARIKLRSYITVPRVAVCFLVTQLYSWYEYSQKLAKYRVEDLELNSAKNVISAFAEAEKDRRHLKMLRRVRDLEREVMKDVPDWEVGTFYGQPIFETVDTEKEWYKLKQFEFTAHTTTHDITDEDIFYWY